MLDALNVTVTVATGTSVTVSCAEPFFVSLVAVIVAAPAPAAVTSPLLFTVATLVFDDDHAMERPVSTAPLASLSVAVACVV